MDILKIKTARTRMRNFLKFEAEDLELVDRSGKVDCVRLAEVTCDSLDLFEDNWEIPAELFEMSKKIRDEMGLK